MRLRSRPAPRPCSPAARRCHARHARAGRPREGSRALGAPHAAADEPRREGRAARRARAERRLHPDGQRSLREAGKARPRGSRGRLPRVRRERGAAPACCQRLVVGCRATRADPLAVAVLLDDLQQVARLPLLFTADFEGREGLHRLRGRRGRRGDGDWGDPRRGARGEGGGAAGEGRRRRSRGLSPGRRREQQPAQPIINLRVRRGPGAVSRMAVAYVKGTQAGGMSIREHFPGTARLRPTHPDLAPSSASASALDEVEAAAVQGRDCGRRRRGHSSHIRLPALDPRRGRRRSAGRSSAACWRESASTASSSPHSMSMRTISERFAPGKSRSRSRRGPTSCSTC